MSRARREEPRREPHTNRFRASLQAWPCFSHGPSPPRLRPYRKSRKGRFEFVDRVAGIYRLRARAAGFLVAESEPLQTPIDFPVSLVLRRGATLAGRVADESGEGIAGAQVSGYQRSSYAISAETLSDESGHFVLAGLVSDMLQVTCFAEGFLPKRQNIQLLPDVVAEPLEVVLQRGATVRGQVSRPDGRPILGAYLKAKSIASADAHSPSATSDEYGHFELDRVPLGPVLITAELGSAESYEEIEVQLGPNQVSLTLPPGVEVSGWVGDASGQPVSSAEVTLGEDDGRNVRPALTDTQGRFTLVDVMPGTYKPRVDHPEHARFEAKATHCSRSSTSRGSWREPAQR